jgi:hypothetical protein
MSWIPRTCICFCLLFVGYVLGALQFAATSPLRADPGTDAIQGTVRDKLRDADRMMSEAMQVLQDDKRYVPDFTRGRRPPKSPNISRMTPRVA